MKKTRFIAFALVCVMLACTFMTSASAVLIDFSPKTSNGKIYGIPANSTAKTVSYAYYNTIVSVYDKSGNVVSAESDTKVGTGFTVKINSTSYTAVVMGDVDGDGRIRALDYIAVKRAYLGTIADLSDLSKEAIGITDGGRVRAIHYVMLKRAVMGNYDMNKDYACTPYVPGADESGWTSGWV